MANRFCKTPGVQALTILLTACIPLSAAQPLQAANACPVRLSDGKMDQGTITIRFMNSGKTPIRELNLDCSPLPRQKFTRVDCHNEAGVFYPGTPYTLRFGYSGKASHAIEVSVESVRQQDGTIWTATQDQPCRPLKVVSK
jgi:hypothetical protein